MVTHCCGCPNLYPSPPTPRDPSVLLPAPSGCLARLTARPPSLRSVWVHPCSHRSTPPVAGSLYAELGVDAGAGAVMPPARTADGELELDDDDDDEAGGNLSDSSEFEGMEDFRYGNYGPQLRFCLGVKGLFLGFWGFSRRGGGARPSIPLRIA